jgi:glycosyltransferase involved in cell wall biosynthesis
MMHQRVETSPHERVDIVSRNLYPPRVADMRAKVNLLHHYAWEESGFPLTWVEDFNSHLNGLTCLSTHVEKTLIDNGVFVPMVTSGAGVDHWDRIAPSNSHTVRGRTFRFLHVSSCFPRKGVDALLDSFGKAFTINDDVSLIIKTFRNPHNTIHDMLAERRSRFPSYPHVVVVEDELSDPDLKCLYLDCHALVAPSRAEGFGLPLAEAMLSGLPVITTAWSGQLDFCNDETAWLVDYKFKRAQSHFNLAESVWAEINIDDLTRTLVAVFNSTAEERQSRAQAARKLLLDQFKWTDVAARLVVSAKSWSTNSAEPTKPRIGWVTTWNTKCGIASYSEHLLRCFPQSVTILAPHEESLIRDDRPNCIRSWRTGKDENEFDELSAQIVASDINTVVLQFNYGLYNFRQLSQFLIDQVDAGRAVLILLHATGDPGLLPTWNWTLGEIVPALARCQRVLVHSLNDLNRLKELGLTHNVCIFPHGVLNVEPAERKRTTDKVPLVATFGFCLPHKGLLELVSAAGILRDRGTPIRLRLVNAQYPIPASESVVLGVQKLVSELTLGELVEAHHEFLTDHQSLELLKDADLIVFPYQETNESASGAVRFGLAARQPVAVTPIPIFADLGDAVHYLKGTQPLDIADGLTEVLDCVSRKDERARKVAKIADDWRSAHGYAQLGARLLGICQVFARRLETFDRVFDASSKQLRTEVGQIVGRSMESVGAAGLLLAGPYLTLGDGKFRVLIRGRFDVPMGAKAYCCVRIRNGSEVLARKDLIGSGDAIIVDLAVTITRHCSDFDVSVYVDRRSNLRVDRIEIRKVPHQAYQ